MTPLALQAKELYDRISEIFSTPREHRNRLLHEVIVLACQEGVRGERQAFGNLFAQVDFLCRKLGIAPADAMAIQKARYDSNQAEPMDDEDMPYDCRAAALLVEYVLGEAVPKGLTALLPHHPKPKKRVQGSRWTALRCVVSSWDKQQCHALTAEASPREIVFDYATPRDGADFSYLAAILHEGMQLNLIDSTLVDNVMLPRLIVVEPDFLVDISTIASCFQPFGHHPLFYTLRRMEARKVTRHTILGNFAGAVLDDLINQEKFSFQHSAASNFRTRALEYASCADFDKDQFIEDAKAQTENLRMVVDDLTAHYDRSKMVLEPSFVCEKLGLQGRVDLMTTDFRLLVEQKAGRNMNIERGPAKGSHGLQKEDNYVQLLLYYGILNENFGRSRRSVDIRLLYSKYPPEQGLMVVPYYRQLFLEAMKFRNQAVATEYWMADHGFGRMLPLMKEATINTRKDSSIFYHRYLYPAIVNMTSPLAELPRLETIYLNRMMTFVIKEGIVGRVGKHEGIGSADADLWNMPLAEKQETGNIYTALKLTKMEKSNGSEGYDSLELDIPTYNEDFLPNFRLGDGVYVYAYSGEPDVRRNFLLRGVLTALSTTKLSIHLNNAQQNPALLPPDALYAVEHSIGSMTSGGISALYAFITAPKVFRDLMLCRREPVADRNLQLSRSYNHTYDEVLLKALRAQDYFLLIGPPGTGKTSMALQYMVREALVQNNGPILLMAYTNRAVDEICAMLDDNGIDYLRIANEYSTDKRFRRHLVEQVVSQNPRLDSVRQAIAAKRIVVGTTSMIASRAYIFNIMHFDLTIIDEAGQILEPSLIGLLALLRQTGRGKFILVGDHKQLPAVVQQDEDESTVSEPELRDICLCNCRDSLFYRLLMVERKAGRSEFCGVLNRQGRMHPDIAEFPNKMFYRRENLTVVPLAHQMEPKLNYNGALIDDTDRFLCDHRVVFIPSEFKNEVGMSDKANRDEAHIVADVLRRIYHLCGGSFDAAKTVGVIVPYRNQIALIRKELELTGIPELLDVCIDTVERYQGSQRDVIVYSFTVSRTYQLDFLAANCFEEDGLVIDRKLNVALTRARKQLVITGNPLVLEQNGVFRALIEYVKDKKGYLDKRK